VISHALSTKNVPDPDLLVRTSGELRISNFLLWQIAYSEIFISSCYWPEFRRGELYNAILDYQKRERRFGMVSEQIQVKPKGNAVQQFLKNVSGI
jgi:undecaprenyl diphosphate synthase